MNDVRSVFRSLELSGWKIANERIRAGGQAKVLVVTNAADEKGVFRCLLDPDSVAIDRFQREVGILTDTRFQHANIVEILDYSSNPNEHWYISRFGSPFKTYWKSVRESSSDPVEVLEKAISIIAKLADGLGPLHKNGVIHRDIKPPNIVMRTNGSAEPVLIDFGIAHVKTLERLTDPDEAVGNQRFSPDVARRRIDVVSPWIDVFQLAQLLIWMLQSPATDTWNRPLDWRFVEYDNELPPFFVAVIRGLTARCCEEGLSPKDGSELCSLIRERVNFASQDAPSTNIDLSKIQEATVRGQSLQDVALAEDTHAVQAAAESIAPVAVEIVDGIHELVTTAVDHGLKVTPGTKKSIDQVVEIAMAKLRRHGRGMYNATFYGDHGDMSIYCNLDIRLPSEQRQCGQEPKTNFIVSIKCTRVGAKKLRSERIVTMESDGSLTLRTAKDAQIASVSSLEVIDMFKGWIEDPNAWESMQRDR